MARGPYYSSTELDHAWHLRAQGLTWRRISERLGRPHSSLVLTANQYRDGTWKGLGLNERSKQINARVEDLVLAGVTTIHGIARELGVSDPSACRRLMRLGLDAEMRPDAAQSIGVR